MGDAVKSLYRSMAANNCRRNREPLFKTFSKNTFIKVSMMLNTLPHLYLNCQSFLGKKKIYIYTDRKWIKYRQVTK